MTKLDRQKFIELIRKGHSAKEIAKIFGLTRKKVTRTANYLRKCGIELPFFVSYDRLNINKKKFIKLMLSGCSSDEIAKRFGITKAQARGNAGYLRKQGIELPHFPKTNKFNIDRQKFIKLVRKGLSSKEIAVIFGLTRVQVTVMANNFRRCGIELPFFPDPKPIVDKEKFIKLAGKGYSLGKIAKHLGLTTGQLSFAACKYRKQGIELPLFSTRTTSCLNIDREKFFGLVRSGLSVKEVAKTMKLKPLQVRCLAYYHRKQGIKLPHFVNPDNIMVDRKKFIKLILEGYSIDKIAKRFGITRARVSHKAGEIRRQGIELPYFLQPRKFIKDEEKFIKMVQKGHSRDEIARRFGITKKKVTLLAKNYRRRGIELPHFPDTIPTVDREKFIELVRKGHTLGEIAVHLGLAKKKLSYVAYKYRKQGIKLPLFSLRRKDRLNIDKEKFAKLVHSGFSASEVAKRLGITNRQVHSNASYLRKLGFKLPYFPRKDPSLKINYKHFIKFVHKGFSAEKIAAELKLTITRVYSVARNMRKLGFKLPYFANNAKANTRQKGKKQ